MSKFERSFKEIEAIKQEELYNLLNEDIKNGDVFPAFRNGNICFYYKGGRLFLYKNNKFSTHIKYAFTPENNENDYVSETDLEKIKVNTSFVNSYNKIKERCKKYGNIEAETVSVLYKENMYNVREKKVMLLDTEIALNDSNKNRIDLLLYNVESKNLIFCEAKHFSNKEIWAEEGRKPKVVEQIDRYNKVIQEIGVDHILKEYSNYIRNINELFNVELPLPETISPSVGLLIAGYDNDQKAKIKKLLVGDNSLEGIKYYTAGKLENISNLYDKLK